MKSKKSNKIRMDYATYAYLKQHLEDDMDRLQKDYMIACSFIPHNRVIKGVSVIDEAHDIFTQKLSKLKTMQSELYAAAVSSYIDHPNPKMREFWGIKK